MRPCNHPQAQDGCRCCWLADYDPYYRALWEPHPPAVPDRPFRKHLLYHIFPAPGNGIWQWNVNQLLRRINLFDGQRVIAIATAPGLDSPEVVRRYFGGHATRFLEVPNQPHLRDASSLEAMLEVIEPAPGSCEAFFWAHAKSVTRPSNRACRRWTEIMYEVNLDYWPHTENLLREFPVVGAFRKWAPDVFPGSRCKWHYAGSFFWGRSADLFAQSWRTVEKQHNCGAETYPSIHYRFEEAGCNFLPGEAPWLEMYSWDFIAKTAGPQLIQWRKDHQAEQTPW